MAIQIDICLGSEELNRAGEGGRRDRGHVRRHDVLEYKINKKKGGVI